MKVKLQDILSSIKTKSEASTVIDEVWFARSIVGLHINGKVQAIFGFSGEFEQKKSEISSIYELIEHFIFSPFAYSEDSINNLVKYISYENFALVDSTEAIKKFLVGSTGPAGRFYGNGCGISYDLKAAVMHSKRELMERHLCCEIWYRRVRPLFKDKSFQVNILDPSIKLDIYTTDTGNLDTFALAVLECTETGFFVLGSAIRLYKEDAYKHAIGEAVMFFEDAKKGRSGLSSTEQSRKKVLSLRDKQESKRRKDYFYALVAGSPINAPYIMPTYQTIIFKPFPEIYAARTFSKDALNPRQFESLNDIPLMPLF